tara:strand:- start:315 stop:1088 length:774 start_codon:yes stop_codon:yes gene_type:complete
VRTLSSPLRYPNDKTNGATTIASLLPRNVKKVCSPFFGGGSVELSMIKKGVSIFGYSDYYTLCEFWNCLMEDPIILVSMAKHYYPMEDSELFCHMQDNLTTPIDSYVRAAQFYVLNRCAENGDASSGKLMANHPKFTPFAMKKLLLFKTSNLSVGYSANYMTTINSCAPDEFLFCCPPKFEPIFFNMKGTPSIPERPKIDHEKLKDILMQRNNWILSYNFHPKLLTMYPGVKYKLYKSNFRPATDFDSAKEIVFIKN